MDKFNPRKNRFNPAKDSWCHYCKCHFRKGLGFNSHYKAEVRAARRRREERRAQVDAILLVTIRRIEARDRCAGCVPVAAVRRELAAVSARALDDALLDAERRGRLVLLPDTDPGAEAIEVEGRGALGWVRVPAEA